MTINLKYRGVLYDAEERTKKNFGIIYSFSYFRRHFFSPPEKRFEREHKYLICMCIGFSINTPLVTLIFSGMLLLG